METNSVVLDLQFFTPLIQLWAGICLLFFYQPFLKRFPLRAQLFKISDEIDLLFNVELQGVLIDESGRPKYLYTRINWDEFFLNIKNMAALTFFYCIFLLTYLGIEKNYNDRHLFFYHSQDTLFLCVVNIAIIVYLLHRYILISFRYLLKLSIGVLKWISSIKCGSKIIDEYYSKVLSKIKDRFNRVSRWYQTFNKRMKPPRNLRFFWNYVMPFIYICIIFIYFFSFEKYDPFSTDGNHNAYKYIYFCSHKILDYSNLDAERTKLTIFTFITCITGAIVVMLRLLYDFVHIKSLEFKISKLRPDINYLIDARTKPLDQVENSLPEHLRIRLKQEIGTTDNKTNEESAIGKSYLESCIAAIIIERAEHFINSSKLIDVFPVKKHRMRKDDEFTESQETQLQLLLDERLNEAFKKHEDSKVVIQIKDIDSPV